MKEDWLFYKTWALFLHSLAFFFFSFFFFFLFLLIFLFFLFILNYQFGFLVLVLFWYASFRMSLPDELMEGRKITRRSLQWYNESSLIAGYRSITAANCFLSFLNGVAIVAFLSLVVLSKLALLCQIFVAAFCGYYFFLLFKALIILLSYNCFFFLFLLFFLLESLDHLHSIRERPIYFTLVVNILDGSIALWRGSRKSLDAPANIGTQGVFTATGTWLWECLSSNWKVFGVSFFWICVIIPILRTIDSMYIYH